VALQEALSVADLCTVAAGEDRPYARNGGQLANGGVRLQLSGNPVLDLLHLGFYEANVLQGEIEDALNGQGQALIEREALLRNALELVCVLEGIAKVVAADLVQVQGQVFDGQVCQFIQTGLLGEHETTGDTKDVREGLETAIGTGLEEQEGRKVALFTSQVLDEMEAQTGVEP